MMNAPYRWAALGRCGPLRSIDFVQGFLVEPAAVEGGGSTRLHRADPDSGTRDTGGAGGPRPDGCGADRHRQDGRLRVAADRAAAAEPGAPARPKGADTGADTRTGGAGQRRAARHGAQSADTRCIDLRWREPETAARCAVER